jgi:hypothetical protein
VTLLALKDKIADLNTEFTHLFDEVNAYGSSPAYMGAIEALKTAPSTTTTTTTAVPQMTLIIPDPIPLLELNENEGVLAMLRVMFTNAIRKAFPVGMFILSHLYSSH